MWNKLYQTNKVDNKIDSNAISVFFNKSMLSKIVREILNQIIIENN